MSGIFNHEEHPDPTIETEPPVRCDVIEAEVLYDSDEHQAEHQSVVRRLSDLSAAEVVRTAGTGAVRTTRLVRWWCNEHRLAEQLHHLEPGSEHHEEVKDKIDRDLWRRSRIYLPVTLVGSLWALWLALGALSVLGGLVLLWCIGAVLAAWCLWCGAPGAPLGHRQRTRWAPPPVHHRTSTTGLPCTTPAPGGAPSAPPESTTPSTTGAPVSAPPESTGAEHQSEELHYWADKLQEGLRAYKLIARNEEIQASAPVSMERGHGQSNGTSFTVTLPLTCPASAAVEKLHELATALDTTDERLILLPAGGSNRLLWVWKCDQHPLGGAGTWSPLQDAPEVNVWEGWEFGWTVTGERVRISVVGDRMLVAGSPGSGKSASVNLIPLGYALDPTTRSILMDPEGFGSWEPFSDVAEVIEGSDLPTLHQMAAKLEWVVSVELVRRQAEVKRLRKEEPMLMSSDAIDERISRDQRYNLPPLLIAIDEVSSLLRCSDKWVRETSEWALGEISRRCRKYAITLVLISQKCTTDNVPSHITAMMTSQYLGHCQTTPMADCVIPDWRTLGMNPRGAIKPDDKRGGGTPGAGYLHGLALAEPFAPWVLMRTDYVPSASIRAALGTALQRRTELRPELLPSAEVTPVPDPVPDAPPGDEEQREPAVDPWTTAQRCLAVIEPNGALAASAVMDELIHRWPVEYGGLASSRRELERLLEGTGLACRQTSDGSGSRPYALRWSDVAKTLRDAGLWGEATRSLQESSPGDSGPETAPDQGERSSPSNSAPDTIDGGFT